MYVELLKALYGTLRAARLFWEMLSKQLMEWGFEVNPYDTCVANKTVNGKQMTVAWHVDDLKVSHVEKEVVEEFVANMRETFGKEMPLSENRGKVHDYLGMTLDFSEKGTVGVHMKDYVKMMLSEIPSDMVGTAPTPAANHLFKTNANNEDKLLDQERRETFVRLTMQALYLSQ
eukprot:Nitzschia sp. Nitz4//scaffold483_size5322//889//1410//NITZ4_009226-RA/size5322-exonerate_protein2genome-gene-0.0-mRNA-1//-1//CDS//3329552879//913//frame0